MFGLNLMPEASKLIIAFINGLTEFRKDVQAMLKEQEVGINERFDTLGSKIDAALQREADIRAAYQSQIDAEKSKNAELAKVVEQLTANNEDLKAKAADAAGVDFTDELARADKLIAKADELAQSEVKELPPPTVELPPATVDQPAPTTDVPTAELPTTDETPVAVTDGN